MAILPIASGLSILCYLASTGMLTKRFFAHANDSVKVPIAALILGLVAHLSVIIISVSNLDAERLSLIFVLLVITWLITFSMLIANKFIKNLVFLPIVSLGSALFVTLHLFLPSTTGISAQMSAGLLVHISLSMLAFGFLGIAMLYALQLGYINYQLKHKKRTLLRDDLPPLLGVENILYKLMTIGTVILFASLATGFLFVPSILAQGYGHKTLLSSIALVIFIVALVFHKAKGMATRTAIWVNIIGVALLSLSYFGSRLVQEIIIGS